MININNIEITPNILNKIAKMKTTMKEAYTFDIDKIRELGAYITETKETGLYGGKYE